MLPSPTHSPRVPTSAPSAAWLSIVAPSSSTMTDIWPSPCPSQPRRIVRKYTAMLDCDQFQSESDQRGDIRHQDSRSRMLFRIVWQFNSCRHQDRLGKQQVTTRSHHGRHIGQAAIEGLIMRYMHHHVHARDETPLRLDFIGDQTVRLADIGNPRSGRSGGAAERLYRGSNQVEPRPSTFHPSRSQNVTQ